jgi:hypothetical protein
MTFREQIVLFRRMFRLIKQLEAEIEEKNDAIAEMHQVSLASQQAYLDLVVAWRISLEMPENDMRDELDTMIATLRDQVAHLEEHVV